MLNASYTFGKIFNIPLKLHISLLIPLFWALNTGNVAISLLFVIGIMASITAHELAHCVVAQHYGCRVREIKLTLIGGIASLNELPKRPREEMIMAAAGPAVSLLIGAALILVSKLAPNPASPWGETFYTMRNVGVILALTMHLGMVNIVIGVFNLIPAIPLDGGRILRAALTPQQGFVRATFTSMRIGKILAVILGILSIRWGNFPLFIIAVFIFFGAVREYAQARVKQMMGGEWFSQDESVEDDEVEVSASPWEKKKGKKRIRIKRD